MQSRSSPGSPRCTHSISNAAPAPGLRRGSRIGHSLLKTVAAPKNVALLPLDSSRAGRRWRTGVVGFRQSACLEGRSLVVPSAGDPDRSDDWGPRRSIGVAGHWPTDLNWNVVRAGRCGRLRESGQGRLLAAFAIASLGITHPPEKSLGLLSQRSTRRRRAARWRMRSQARREVLAHL